MHICLNVHNFLLARKCFGAGSDQRGVAAVINCGYSFKPEGICVKLRLFGLYSHVLVNFFCCMTNPRTEIGPKFLQHSMNHSGYSCSMSRVIRCFWLLKSCSFCLTLVFSHLISDPLVPKCPKVPQELVGPSMSGFAFCFASRFCQGNLSQDRIAAMTSEVGFQQGAIKVDWNLWPKK